MVAVSAAIISSVARALSPVVADLYKGAKGKIKESLQILSVANGAKRLARGLLKIESVKTIWSPDKELSILDFYYPSRICNDDDNEEREVKRIGQLPDGNLVIQGIVGQGKSIFMRYLASAAMRDEECCVIPIFLELRTLSAKKNIFQSIGKFFESVGLEFSDELFSYLASSGKLILLLDGFDEVSPDCLRDTLEEIEYMQVKYPEMRIIVSSRPSNDIQMVSGFRVVDLSVLNSADYDPFLRKLKVATAKRVELIHAIAESSSTVGGIISTPLMMTLVVLVYEAEREIPPTLPEFFEKMFHVVFTRHDRLKLGFSRRHYSGLSERKLQQLFEAFCFMVIQSGSGRSLTGEQFNEAFDLALDYAEGCKCDVEDFKKDIVKVACLMLEEGVDVVTFLHKSILEYYAAAFIKHSSPEVASLFYKEAGVDRYRSWSDVLRFLASIDSYRYSKEYILQGGPDFLKMLQDLIAAEKKSELLKFILSIHSEIGICFEADGAPISYGPLNPTNDPWVNYIDNYLMRAFFNLVVAESDIELVVRAIKGNVEGVIVHEDEDEEGFNIHVRDLMEMFGVEGFWEKLKEAENDLRGQILIAEKVVEIQDKRKMIFSKRKTKAGEGV
ncbi:NACHT domain-containing protein [Pseudomonas frederiksbergensis]|uniref:NACHT domain-containing protein n=1 Tax=Pseudomonas frederiksbergensis TaxID=104087 RepID=UPI00197F286B|nr:NACHT domain-containing protein [Pseudomonas frederiksbergensis]MBN3862102.1 NACHT domain-containing protein [Pseudomonas frederiksbergensis]